MKKHFGKQIIERPRHGSRTARSAKARSYGKFIEEDGSIDYEGFTRLPVSRKQEGLNKKLGDKSFTDVLGPLKNYLVTSCGKSWNDVYSEIKKTLGHCGWAVEHIVKDHIRVETHTWRGSDGHIYADNRYGVTRLDYSYYRTGEFYVEPETGLLRQTPHEPRYRRKPDTNPDVIKVREGLQYRRIEGIWYEVEFVMTPVHELRGYIRGTPHYRDYTIETIVRKQQLGKKDLKRLNLR